MSFAAVEELPLKKPENYDFSVRGVDWGKYEHDYLLRTDAVWEKSKLYAYFYSLYKQVILFFIIIFLLYLLISSQNTIIKKIFTMIFQLNTM